MKISFLQQKAKHEMLNSAKEGQKYKNSVKNGKKS
jgi:hypothetical protein